MIPDRLGTNREWFTGKFVRHENLAARRRQRTWGFLQADANLSFYVNVIRGTRTCPFDGLGTLVMLHVQHTYAHILFKLNACILLKIKVCSCYNNDDFK